MKPEKPSCCETCNRIVALSFHHLIPKKVHKKASIKKLHGGIDFDHHGVWVCRDCHKKIHKLFDHFTLGVEYYSLSRLRSSVEFRKFLSWVRKQKKRVK